KQRFANILPYDFNRVKLEKIEGQPLSDYINASHVKVGLRSPTPDTLTDFWRMVWEQKVERIAMLTNLVENGVVNTTNSCSYCFMYFLFSG
ncbi:hypothetical protein CAPTEDRAFT_104956, partial [Capitella teleta]